MSIEYYNDVFSDNLQYYMNLRGITAAELSRKIGVSKPTMSDYVHGKTLPKMEKFDAICRALSVDRKDLLTERTDALCQAKSELIKLVSAMTEDQARSLLDFLKSK